jgi:hypothetical protein
MGKLTKRHMSGQEQMLSMLVLLLSHVANDFFTRIIILNTNTLWDRKDLVVV